MKVIALFLVLFTSSVVITAQYIPEEVRIKQYVRSKYKGASAYPNGMYVIKQRETTGQSIQPHDTVTVHYEGYFFNGKVFDSSYERGEPIQFVVGAGQVIQGWDDGLLLMNEGEQAVFVLPSALGYGSQQVGPIPPDTPLVFKLEVIKVGN